MKYSPAVISLLIGLAVVSVAIAMYRRSSARKPDGDAPSMIFQDANGQTVTPDELQRTDGIYNYKIVGGGEIPEKAASLHDEARQAGSEGRYKDAIHLPADGGLRSRQK
jgi:hypothetical protein